jgi:hypothetical protein
MANERPRVSHANGAGIAGVPASERAGGSGGAKPPGFYLMANERERVPAYATATARSRRRASREGGSHASGVGSAGVPALRRGSGRPERQSRGAGERAGEAGPPSPRSGFGEVSPEPAGPIMRAEADGAKTPGY